LNPGRDSGEKSSRYLDVSDDAKHIFNLATPLAMSSSGDDIAERKISRRRFLKWVGTLAAVGAAVAVGGGLGNLTALLPKLSAETTAPFSVFWITDTQFLSETNPTLFKTMTNWITDNWSAFNGKLVIHTGDIVQTGAHQVEWENADEAMSVLLQNSIPYAWCAGNHDLVGGQAAPGWNGNLWASAFNPEIVSGRMNGLRDIMPGLRDIRWVSDYHNGMNTAVSFSANGLNFLVVNIEWNAEPDILEWVGKILDDPAHADHRVIIATHAYIDARGSTNDSRWGETLATFVSGLTTVMDKHSSRVFLTLNGHFATDCGYNTPSPINNRNELMFDRQDSLDLPDSPTGRGVDELPRDSPTTDIEKVGGATVTILTFDTENNQIAVRTYDVYTGKWREDSTEQYTVTMSDSFLIARGVAT
jgi:hypothetical protein